ncbi:MAG: 5'-nucleotidase C-terminal domain-containing protein [Bacteroidales bacterium]|nr:5'-nucleotidase C-terminal domain-containing protein [Bacteroidales bacterium]
MRIKLVLLFILFAGIANAQQVRSNNFKSIKWSQEEIHSNYDNADPSTLKSDDIIAKYKPEIDQLLDPIGTTARKMDKYSPDYLLAYWAVDVMREFANDFMKKNRIKGKCDMSITNFGGIRASLPEGEINSYDILTIFPFDNRVVILELEGKYLRELMENFAKRGRVEALSGVEIVINKKVLEKCLINGKPIKDDKIYKVATIDFLLDGGDNVYALKYASKVIKTEKKLMDVYIDHIKSETAKGKVIDQKSDSRITIIK